ncbi:hypothetical protein NM208_g1642 [Fusarium decemcellulare]|uniref:Uncharacterized protein n=2 Tax=Fusarium decemcellulare TaxID=57161 RepID=A0ACC1STM9_9HYPO|nr:hypothetical protein NM208_g2086 [Fusarium decemcellulare]KAJ3547196.1 hypothetical protein NM208_g1642 [Fusarium decemcellulare]
MVLELFLFEAGLGMLMPSSAGIGSAASFGATAASTATGAAIAPLVAPILVGGVIYVKWRQEQAEKKEPIKCILYGYQVLNTCSQDIPKRA